MDTNKFIGYGIIAIVLYGILQAIIPYLLVTVIVVVILQAYLKLRKP